MWFLMEISCDSLTLSKFGCVTVARRCMERTQWRGLMSLNLEKSVFVGSMTEQLVLQ